MGNENEGICQYELERMARIAENKKRMQEMGIFAVADALFKTCNKPKQPAKPRAKKLFVDAGPVRKSDRQQNKPPVNYSDDFRLERLERQPRAANFRQQRRVPVGARMPNFPIQSAAAIQLATEAAQAKVEQLGGRGFYKEMQPSNVSSGYWLQLPVDMGTTYRFSYTADIELECLDECKNDDGWQYQKSRNRWHVRWLVRGGNSCGLSGGWRGFSIDQQLTWNDTVVFEIPADVLAGQLPTYVKIHTFRAENYETAETQAMVVPAKEVFEALMAKLPKEEGEEDDSEEAPNDAPDADQAAGEGKGADKEKAAVLRARKKRIAEVAGSLKTAAAEHKRQKKAAAAATNADAAVEEQADVDMKEADGAAELADAADDGAKDGAGESAAGEKDADAAAAAEAAASKRKRGAKTQKAALAKGKENAPQPPARKSARQQKETRAAEGNGAKASKPAADSKKKKPAAKKEPAQPEPEAQEEEGVEEVFYVEQVLKVRKVRSSAPEFLIRWYGYAAEHDTWEPLGCLDDGPFEYKWADDAAKEAARAQAAKWATAE